MAFSLLVASWLATGALMILEKARTGTWPLVYWLLVGMAAVMMVFELAYVCIRITQLEGNLSQFELVTTSLFFARFGALLIWIASFIAFKHVNKTDYAVMPEPPFSFRTAIAHFLFSF